MTTRCAACAAPLTAGAWRFAPGPTTRTALCSRRRIPAVCPQRREQLYGRIGFGRGDAVAHAFITGNQRGDFHCADEGGRLGASKLRRERAGQIGCIAGVELDGDCAGNIGGAAADDVMCLGKSRSDAGHIAGKLLTVADHHVEAFATEIIQLVGHFAGFDVGDDFSLGLEIVFSFLVVLPRGPKQQRRGKLILMSAQASMTFLMFSG